MKIDEKTRKKALVLLILILIAMLIPIKISHKDGGTIEYKAVLYSVTNLHRDTVENHRLGTLEGTQVRILFFMLYDDSEFVPNPIDAVLSPAE